LFSDAPIPDFVVLDFHLPDMDAPEVLAMIRRRNDLKHMPVLVLSQAGWADDERRALEAGCSLYCTKPSELDELREIIANFWLTL
jgi:DNA-binding response OmpR family regulator